MEKFIILIMLSALCGTSFSASDHGWIIGGNETTIEKHPYQVALVTVGFNFFFCGGSTISTKLIMTAAHCVQSKKRVFVRFGSTSWKEGGVVRNVISWTTHPEFKWSTLENDIAVARIDEEIPLGPKIAIVGLPNAGDPEEGELITLVGWGRTKASVPVASINLREAIVPVFNQDACNRSYHGMVVESQICVAGEKEGTTGVCKGDSGGVAVKDGIQYGITSYVAGGECVYPNIPQVYTRVSSFLDWITEQISLAH